MVWTLDQYKAALKASQEEANRLNLLSVSTKQESSSAKDAADKAAAKAAETKSIVDNAGHNLKRSQQTAAQNAAKANTLAAQRAADAAAKAAKTKAAKRAAEFAVTDRAYDLAIAKNPYTEEKGRLSDSYASAKKGNVMYKHSYYWGNLRQNYIKKQQIARQEAQKELRFKNYTADGINFSTGTIQRDAAQLLGDINRGKGIGYRNISARGKSQVEKVMAREDLLYGRIDLDQYYDKVGQSRAKLKKIEQQQAQQRSAQARAQVAGYLKEDSEKWNEVVSNSETKQNQLTGAKIIDVKQAPVNELREGFELDPRYIRFSRDGKQVDAKEKSVIEQTIARQRAQEEINREQQKLFNAMRNAPNAAAALKLRSAAMAQNPNVGTFNALFRGDKLQSTSGVFGIGDGTVKDLNYKKFDRATQTFAENPKLGNLTDSQGNVIASNLKSSSGSEWNFSPVTTPTTAKEEESKLAQGIPVSPTTAGFLGGLNLFAQSPKSSSNTVSTQTAVPTYEFRLEQYNNNFDLFNAKWDGVEEFTSQEQADEYAAEYDALNLQYENLSDEFEIQQQENEEWGDYLKPNEGWYGYVQNELRPKDMPRDQYGNVDDPVTGSAVKVGWNVVAAINNLGVWGSKTIDPKTYKDTEYVKYYSTPITNLESGVFGTAIGTAQQGAGFYTSGSAENLWDVELGQIDKNFKRNSKEAALTTVMEGAFYPIFGTARWIQKGATKIFGTLGQTAESTAKAGAKGAAKGAASSAPKPPTPKYTPEQIAQAKKDWSDIQQGITSPSQKAQQNILKIIQSPEAKKTYPKDPTPSELKLFDNVVSGKVNKVPKYNVPTVFKNIGKVADDLPIIKTNNKPVKLKDGNLPKRPEGGGIKIIDEWSLPPIKLPPTKLPPTKLPPTKLPPTPKGKPKGFAFPFGWPSFSGRSGGGGVGYKGKPQSKRKFTAWDVRIDKIGFYGFGRKSDSYGGVFGELDELDKVARAEKKTKKKKNGFDEVFNFNFEF